MTPSALRSWFAREHPRWNWDNRCAGAAYQTCVATGTAVRTYPTATAARDASVIRSRDISKAPAGAFHFWEYWANLGGVYANYGHVALELGGGWALMSNPEAWDEQWGIALGVTDVAEWTRRRAGILTYLGWSATYGDNTAHIDTDASSSADAAPFQPSKPQPGVILMPNISIVFNLDSPDPKEQFAVGPRGRVSLDGQTADLLARWMQWQVADGKTIDAGGMTVAEMDLLIGEVLKKIS